MLHPRRWSLRQAGTLVLAACLVLPACRQPPQAQVAPEEKSPEPPARKDILAKKKKLYSQHDEEVIIRDFFQDRREGFFLDVGCAWPKKNSNTYYLESELGWSGIGVDALPEFAEDWRRKRPKSRFFNYIATDRAGLVQTFYRAEGLPGISSIQPRKMFSGKEVKYAEIKIPTITLTKLLDDNHVSKVDLLSMDIEGAELLALAGFDIDRFRPELVCIEAYHAGRDKVLAYFAAHGYETIDRYRDRDKVNDYFTPRTKSASPVP
jgi:FkbM family methyltransferase